MATVSVITIVKDHAAGLEATHKSLLEQSYTDWEMVIVTGASQDGTLDVAKEIQSNDPRILLLEQISSGIYEAMNEGLALVSGEFTWFLNAGDKFASTSVLAHGVNQISQNRLGVVVGGYQIESSSQNKTYSYPSRKITGLRFAFNRRGGCHQAMIFRTNVLKDLGGFNTSYSLAADFDLVLRVIDKSKASRVSDVYASIEPGGRADQGIFLVHNQKHQIRKNLFGGVVICLGSFLWTALARLKIILRGTTKK